MERLNVLIGPNGSGKSNLLEVLALLRAAPREIAEPVKRGGGVWEWLWKGDAAPDKASLEAIVEDPHGQRHVCHELQFVDHGGRFEVTDERIEYAGEASTRQESEFTYRLQGGRHTFTVCPLDGGRDVSFGDEWSVGDNGRAVGGPRERAKPDQSVLSQLRDASRYSALHCLQEQYEQIRLYRDWSFGPSATLRRNQSAHDRADFLLESGENAALVLSGFRGKHKRDLVETLQELFDGIVDFTCEVKGGTVSVFLEERNGRQIPATRLSDGTLRYLCLLAILLHPEPPSLVSGSCGRSRKERILRRTIQGRIRRNTLMENDTVRRIEAQGPGSIVEEIAPGSPADAGRGDGSRSGRVSQSRNHGARPSS